MPSNDNDPAVLTARTIDAHGQAALVLVESLIHGLILRSVLTAHEGLDIVTAAIDVQVDYIAEAGSSAPNMRRSMALLSSIATSLETDL